MYVCVTVVICNIPCMEFWQQFVRPSEFLQVQLRGGRCEQQPIPTPPSSSGMLVSEILKFTSAAAPVMNLLCGSHRSLESSIPYDQPDSPRHSGAECGLQG